MSHCHTQEQNPGVDIQVWNNEGLGSGGDNGEDEGKRQYLREPATWLDVGEGQMN